MAKTASALRAVRNDASEDKDTACAVVMLADDVGRKISVHIRR